MVGSPSLPQMHAITRARPSPQISIGFGDTDDAAHRLMPKDIWSTPPRLAALKKLGDPDWALYRLNLNLYQAMDLISSDEDGLCDAYVAVYLEERQPEFTDAITKSRYPCWYQRLDFCAKDSDEANPDHVLILPALHWLRAGWGGRLTLMVFDTDAKCVEHLSEITRVPMAVIKYGQDDQDANGDGDFLGRISFSIEDIIEDTATFGEPVWHPLQRTSLETGKPFTTKKVGKEERGNGKILLSCTIKQMPSGKLARGASAGSSKDTCERLSEYFFEELDGDPNFKKGRPAGYYVEKDRAFDAFMDPGSDSYKKAAAMVAVRVLGASVEGRDPADQKAEEDKRRKNAEQDETGAGKEVPKMTPEEWVNFRRRKDREWLAVAGTTAAEQVKHVLKGEWPKLSAKQHTAVYKEMRVDPEKTPEPLAPEKINARNLLAEHAQRVPADIKVPAYSCTPCAESSLQL